MLGTFTVYDFFQKITVKTVPRITITASGSNNTAVTAANHAASAKMDKPKTAPVIHERPKMPRATWEALRGHIISERKRKQEEEVRSEEYERLKKEREHRLLL